MKHFSFLTLCPVNLEMLKLLVKLIAVVATVHASSFPIQMKPNTDLAKTIHTFIKEHSLEVQAIIAHPQMLDHVNEFAASIFVTQSIEVYSIDCTVCIKLKTRDARLVDTRADALFKWFIVFFDAVLEASDTLLRIIDQTPKNQHTGMIFLMDCQAFNSLAQSLIEHVMNIV